MMHQQDGHSCREFLLKNQKYFWFIFFVAGLCVIPLSFDNIMEPVPLPDDNVIGDQVTDDLTEVGEDQEIIFKTYGPAVAAGFLGTGLLVRGVLCDYIHNNDDYPTFKKPGLTGIIGDMFILALCFFGLMGANIAYSDNDVLRRITLGIFGCVWVSFLGLFLESRCPPADDEDVHWVYNNWFSRFVTWPARQIWTLGEELPLTPYHKELEQTRQQNDNSMMQQLANEISRDGRTSKFTVQPEKPALVQKDDTVEELDPIDGLYENRDLIIDNDSMSESSTSSTCSTRLQSNETYLVQNTDSSGDRSTTVLSSEETMAEPSVSNTTLSRTTSKSRSVPNGII